MHGAGTKRWKKPLWMQPASNSWRTYSSASTVSCTRLGREAVHQVGVHQDAGIGEGLGDSRHLLDRHALVHQLASRRSLATSSPPEMAMQPLSASNSRHSSGCEGLLEADIAPPRNRSRSRRMQFVGQGACSALGGAASSTKWKPVCPVSAMMVSMRSASVLCGLRGLVAADVVQAHVAEAALLPVAAVRHRELVPAPVAPQPVHGVEHVEQAQVAVQRQAVPGGGAALLGRIAARARPGRRCRSRSAPQRLRARRRAPGALRLRRPCRCSSSASSTRSPASRVTKSKKSNTRGSASSRSSVLT
jgi:hypothetical protein